MLLSHGADGRGVVAHGAKEAHIVRCPHVIYKAGVCGPVWIHMTTSVIEWVRLIVGCRLGYNSKPICVMDIGCKCVDLLGSKHLCLEKQMTHYLL